jgi:hypothetical protein
MFDYDSYQAEYSKIRSTIDRLPHEQKVDLKRMLVTLEQLVLHIHLEQVTCKQRRKITKDYSQLLTLFELHKENLEQQLVLACLMS